MKQLRLALVTLAYCTLILLINACGQKEEKLEPATQTTAPSAVEPVKPTDLAKRCLVIATSGVNVREKPDINAKVLEKLPLGTSVEIIAQQGDWYQVKTTTKTGWAATRYGTDILLAETGALGRNDQIFFPLNSGTEWNFVSTDNKPMERWRLGKGQNGELVLAISKLAPTISSEFFFINTETDGSITCTISNPYNSPTSYKPKLLFLGFDPKENRVIASRCRASKGSSSLTETPTNSSYMTTVIITDPPESVKTPAGEYTNCFKLERRTISEQEINRNETREVFWFASGLGPVRIDRDDGSLLLSSMTVNPSGFVYPRDEDLK